MVYWIISTDIGRLLSKWAVVLPDGRIQKDNFCSILSEDYGTKMDVALNQGDYMVEYQGQKYFVGEVAERAGENKRELKQDSKAHDDAVLMTLVSIHQSGASGKVKLSMCVPVDNYKTDKGTLKNKLLRPHQITVNGVKRCFEIVDLFVTSEGVVSAFSTPASLTEDKIACFLNIGSYKSNCGAFDHKGNYIDNRSGSLPGVGMNKVDEEGVEMEGLVKMAYDQLSNKMNWEKPYRDARTRKLVEMVVILCGGAAEEVKPHFSSRFKYRSEYPAKVELHPNPLYSDVLGCLQIALKKWKT